MSGESKNATHKTLETKFSKELAYWHFIVLKA